MYVNELTEDYGDEGRKAVVELLRRGEAIGAFPRRVLVDAERIDDARDLVAEAELDILVSRGRGERAEGEPGSG